MKISVFGTGYEGLTQAACLAEVGHRVCCIDTDASRIAQLERGVSPIFENGLEALLAAGTRVCAYDPEAMDEARRIYADAQHLTFADSKEAALEGAHALVIVTEWLNFRIVDFSLLRQALADRMIFDGRNLLDPVQVVGEGLGYYSIGCASGSGGQV